MAVESGICGRGHEIEGIHKFIMSRIEKKKAGILYLTGPPGTGKTMSMDYVLDQINLTPKVSLNCMRVPSSKTILTRICQSVGLDKFANLSESEMISRLEKKFTARTCETYLIVLDEMDKLPKSKNVNTIKKIFSWTQQTNSKLILVGIANTLNLTSRYQSLSAFTGEEYAHVKKIVFQPYSSTDIKGILMWYLENDQNFEDANVDPSALSIISKRFAREGGDIRGALNALRSSIDDTNKQEVQHRCDPDDTEVEDNDEEEIDPAEQSSIMITPPSTPPHMGSSQNVTCPTKSKLITSTATKKISSTITSHEATDQLIIKTPVKRTRERTNIASVATSIKKRQKDTQYLDDQCPFPHQIVLTCILSLSSKSKDRSADSRACGCLVEKVFAKYNFNWSRDDYLAILDHMEVQGLISVKKGRAGSSKLQLKAGEFEITNLLQRKDIIENVINSF